MLGEMSIEILKSAKVSSNKIAHAGYKFDYPTLHSALNDLL
jgi:NAD dependent epimerase/dehydratase family enzyme